MTKRPTMEETLMRMAEVVALRSTCARARVGCVVATGDLTSVVSMGYNGNARGLPNRCDSDEPGACGCLHAEENALLKAPYGAPLVMFTTTSPCPTCAKRVLNSSVRTVYYREVYRRRAGLYILEDAGIEVTHLPASYPHGLGRENVCQRTEDE